VTLPDAVPGAYPLPVVGLPDAPVAVVASGPAVVDTVAGTITYTGPGQVTLTWDTPKWAADASARYGFSGALTVAVVGDPGEVSPAGIASVTVAGVPEVGQTLTAAAAGVTPSDATVTYQWSRDGELLGTGSTYVPTVLDQGHDLVVTATAFASGYVPAAVSSAPVPVPVTVVVDGVVPDPAFRACLNSYVGQDAAWPVTAAQLQNLRGGVSCFGGASLIASIEGAQYLTSLMSLDLVQHQISDLTPLTGLTALSWLSLQGNQISDLTPLANLTRLSTLYLDDNEITEVAPLQGLGNLTSLSMNRNQISDPSPVVGLPRLTRLYLDGNPGIDITSLCGLTVVTTLSLNGDGLNDLRPIAGLTTLTFLTLGDNAISDLTPLTNLTSVQVLYLDNNQISDLSPLRGFTGLTFLYLYGNTITDLTPLAGLPVVSGQNSMVAAAQAAALPDVVPGVYPLPIVSLPAAPVAVTVSGPATVDTAAGTITYAGPGEVTLTWTTPAWGNDLNAPYAFWGTATVSVAAAPLPVPLVTGLTPSQGTVSGGTTVAVTGTGFSGAVGVAFGTVPAASYVVTSDTTITAITPPGSAGAVDVRVTTPGGTSAAGQGVFTYVDNPPPAVPIVVPVSTITVSQPAAPVTAGNTLRLVADVRPALATVVGVTWTSADPSIATVDAQGRVTAVSAGETRIVATAMDGSGVTGSATVTVTLRDVPLPDTAVVAKDPETIVASTTGGAARLATGADPCPLVATIRNAEGEVLVGVADKLTAEAPAGVTVSEFVDNGDGTYGVAVTATKPGNYEIAVSLDGESVSVIHVNFIGAETAQPTRSLGQAQTSEGLGFLPREQVAVIVHSDPIAVGTFTADTTGRVSATFPLPTDFALGSHTVEFVGAVSGTAVVGFTVVAAVDFPTGGTVVADRSAAYPLLLGLVAVAISGLTYRVRARP
jgi:hypothetical protein